MKAAVSVEWLSRVSCPIYPLGLPFSQIVSWSQPLDFDRELNLDIEYVPIMFFNPILGNNSSSFDVARFFLRRSTGLLGRGSHTKGRKDVSRYWIIFVWSLETFLGRGSSKKKPANEGAHGRKVGLLETVQQPPVNYKLPAPIRCNNWLQVMHSLIVR